MHQIRLGWGSASDLLGELSALHLTPAGFLGPTSNRREERKDGREEQGKATGKVRVGKKEEGREGEDNFRVFPQF